MIWFVIAPVKSFFADCEGGLDCERISVVDGGCGKVFINVIHGRDDSGNTGCPLGKE